MKFLIVALFLAICGSAFCSPSYHQDQGHDIKYIVVTKQEAVAPAQGWEVKNSDSKDHIVYETVVGKHSGYSGEHDDEDKDAKYEFDYGVKDLKTGDIKNQWEHRDGDRVKGTYSLIEADGTTRLVEYSADDHNGFNAVVKKIGHAEHPTVHSKSAHLNQGYVQGHDSHASSYVNVKHH